MTYRTALRYQYIKKVELDVKKTYSYRMTRHKNYISINIMLLLNLNDGE